MCSISKLDNGSIYPLIISILSFAVVLKREAIATTRFFAGLA